MDTRIIHNFLDDNHTGGVNEGEFLLLRAFNSAAAGGGAARCKTFIMERFGDLKTAYNLMFGDPSEFYKVAESKLPRVEWPVNEISLYKGREWLQQFFNMLNDPRGRQLAGKEKMPGGAWLYLFPRLKAEESADEANP